MTKLDVFLRFGTVFLGVFLAFLSDNRREHQQLKKRANAYLKQLGHQLIDLLNSQESASNDLKKTVKAYEKLYQVSDEATFDDWDELTQLFYGVEDDFSYLLKTEVTQVLPVDFVVALAALEGAIKIHGLQRSLVNQIHQTYIFPLVLDPHFPLTRPEQLAVAYCSANIEELIRIKEVLIEKSKEVVTLLNKHNLGR